MQVCSTHRSRDRKGARRLLNGRWPGRTPTFAALFLAFVAVQVSDAQWLELSGRPDPPPLNDDTYAAALAFELERELDDRSADDVAGRASVNMRRLAHALLQTTSNDAEEASILIVRGMKLHAQRESIDESLRRIARNHDRQRDDSEAAIADHAMRLLREFNDLIEQRLSRDTPLRVVEAVALLAPLDEAIDLHSRGSRPPHLPSFDDLRGHATPDDEIRAVASEIADFFERGWTFADLRPRIRQWHALLGDALGSITAVTDATWLDSSQRAACFRRLREALHAFRDPQRRSEGERQLHAVIAEARLLRAITTLAQNRSHRPDLDALRAVLDAAHATWGFDGGNPDDDRLIERLDWLAAIVDRMNRFRSLDRDATPFDHWRNRVQVVDAYLAAEKSLLAKLEELVTQPQGAIADPALGALLGEHRRLLDDLVRLQSMQRLADAITLIRPASAGMFNDQMRRLANLLGDPVRRVDAAFALDRIESEVSRFWPLPFEDELRLRTRVAERATGSRHRELLDEIDSLRDAWASELSEEGPALSRPAAQRLEAIHQLTSVMADVAELLRDEHVAAALNNQPDWWMPPGVVRAALDRLQPALERATRFAVDADAPRVLEELRSIERQGAIARLVGRRIANHERIFAGQGDAALICRYAMEAIHAESRGREGEANQFWTFANRIASIALTTDH